MINAPLSEASELAVKYQPFADRRYSSMTRIIPGKWRLAAVVFIVASASSCLMAQQKGQYQPGQYGLNAGVLPDQGITYVNLDLNYNAGQLNFANGTPVKATGTYNVWVMENILFYVPKFKILGAKFAPYIAFPTVATGSLTLPFLGNGVTVGTSGFGLADTWFQPLNLGWHLPRADVWAGYAFMAPTGIYKPGSTSNIGSGYWGNHFNGAGTFYITKDQGTTANIMGDWEIHGAKTTRSSDISTMFGTLPINVQVTPGTAFTDEWGLGQAIPLDRPFLKSKTITKVVQLGLIGYDQAQVSRNTSNNSTVDTLERLVPFYYVHAGGLQANYIDLKRDWNVFVKYEKEYKAEAHPKGTTIVFGVVYTFRIPKPVESATLKP
jgi:hypothetical protein